MTINVDDSFEVSENGISLFDNDGGIKLYLTSGTGAPSLDAPVNSWYFREDTQQVYRKISAGPAGWEEFVASTAAAIEIESFSDPSQQNTTSNGWVISVDFQTEIKLAGSYLLSFSSLISNSNNNTRTGNRVQWKPASSATWITIIDPIISFRFGGNFAPVTGLFVVDLISDDNIDFRFEFGQTSAGGTGRIKQKVLTVIKTEVI